MRTTYCLAKINNCWEKTEFLGVFQESEIVPPSLMKGGHAGGVVATPIAIVMFGGKLHKVYVGNIDMITEVEE